jgi:hypothetical protein
MRQIGILMLILGAISFTGCADYSHLREEPDYKNMTDSGDEEIAPEESERSP